MESDAIRVIAIDDHPLMLKIIAEELTGHPDIRFVGQAGHASQLFRLVRETRPDVVVLDLGMTGEAYDPVTAVRELRHLYPQIQVLVLTGYDNELYIRQLTQAGVRGYLLKSDGSSLNLADAVRRIQQGEMLFSPAALTKLLARQPDLSLNDRETGIIRLVAEGYSNQGIGEILSLSERRVRNILTSIYARLGIQGDNEKNRRVLLVTRARELGLLD